MESTEISPEDQIKQLSEYLARFDDVWDNHPKNMLLEQYFNGNICTWPLFISGVLTVTIGCYILFRLVMERVMIWDDVEGNREADQIKRKTRRMILANTLVGNNYFYLLLWYGFSDTGTIFKTNIDMMAFYFIFLHISLVYASFKILEKFIAEQLDPQIISTAMVNLQKSELFHTRACKLIAFT
jgi:hypothetical protein